MKKNLTLLTGIAFVLAILIAGGCKQRGEQKALAGDEGTPTDLEYALTILDGDSTKVFVYLKDTLMGGKKHLEMYNVKHTGEEGKKVIDSLYTDVLPGSTVFWKKTNKAEIQKILLVRLVDSMPWNLKDTCLVGEEAGDEERALIKFVIPSTKDTGTVKYEILFKDQDKKIWCIDPYLRIKGTRSQR